MLNVTRQDEEMHSIQTELKVVQDKMAKAESEVEHLRNTVDALTAEKNDLSKQLAAEADLLSETEEVRFVLSLLLHLLGALLGK